jgi:membrane-associated phospholipid phosphatase
VNFSEGGDFVKQLFVDMVKDYRAVGIRLIYMISFLITSAFYGVMNQYRGRVYEIPAWIDSVIPFNKYFILAYVFWYVYLAGAFIYFIVRNEKVYFKLLWGINVGMMIAFIVYFFFPTTVPRPEIIGNDIFSNMVRWIYGRDNPYNCFPSIHVIDSVLIAIYVNREYTLSKWIKGISLFSAFMIILSTMYVKQHYFYDAVGGIATSYIVYSMFNYKAIASKLRDRFAPQAAPKAEAGKEQVL